MQDNNKLQSQEPPKVTRRADRGLYLFPDKIYSAGRQPSQVWSAIKDEASTVEGLL
jgi:hypothetical protein